MVTSSKAPSRYCTGVAFSLLLILAGHFPGTALAGKPSSPAVKGPEAAPRAGVPKQTPAAPAGQPRGVDRSPIQALTSVPDKINLQGRYTEARVLFDGPAADGTTRDVTPEVSLSVNDTRVATVDENGTVRPRSDGSTVLIARLQGREARVPIQVQGVTNAKPPRFLTEVLPVLTKAGCNQGACHGAAAGKGGFKLSLLGYDPDFDYESITRLGGARRLTRSQPDNSLFLRKPALTIRHGGGKRFAVDSPEYRLLRDWITGGLPAPAANEPRVARLEVIPAVRTLAVGRTQRFIVRAHYNDGSQRDASGQTLFTASDETVASVEPIGEARVVGPGEGAVVIRYQGLVATARVISPYGPPRQKTSVAAISPIDQLVFAKLAALGLEPSGRCTDEEFVRRAYLDVTGLLPTPDEVRSFLWSHEPQKREKLIDALLERPEYVDFWTMKWGDLLRNSRRTLSDKGMFTFYRWIRQSVVENKPWDQFSRELLLSRGSGFKEGPANYFRIASKPEDLAETTAQVFLGVRVQCARCHNHPFEKWTQRQYYQLAAFFARVKTKRGDTQEEQDVYLTSTGEVQHPKTGKNLVPTALDAAPVSADYQGDRRRALVEWLTSGENPFFSHIIANRVWGHFMGRGLVEPVDDLRATNPPSNEALFDYLADDLVKHKFDLKYLMRSIMRSQTYQLSSRSTPANERDTRYYSHYAFKRLGAEQLLDALGECTGVPEKFDGFPSGTRAAQLPDSGVPSYFLDVFGRPARQITCECERTSEPNVAQVLHLMNSAGVNDKLASKNGRVAQLVDAKLPARQVVDMLYLSSVSRYPSLAESRTAIKAIESSKEPQKATEDLLWALLNSKEFLFNH